MAKKINNDEHFQTIIKSAPKAYDNLDFLHSRDGRVIRLLAEYLYPKRQFERQKISRGIIFFGSARIASEDELNSSIKHYEKISLKASDDDYKQEVN